MTSHISEVNPPPKPGKSIFAHQETLIEAKQPVPEQSFYSVRKNVETTGITHVRTDDKYCLPANSNFVAPMAFQFDQPYTVNVDLSGFINLGNTRYYNSIYIIIAG